MLGFVRIASSAALRVTVAATSVLLVLCASPARCENEALALRSGDGFDLSIAIVDQDGVQQRLVSSLKGASHLGGGNVVAYNGRTVAFSVIVPPVIDDAHQTAGTEGAFLDGTPGFRRGNRLMLAPIPAADVTPPARVMLISSFDSWAPSWAPDDSAVAYYSNEGGEVQLWIYDIVTHERRRVSSLQIRPQIESSVDGPVWALDGKTIFVAVVTGRVRDGIAPRANPYGSRPGDPKDARSWVVYHSDHDIASSAIAAIDVTTGHSSFLSTSGPINFIHPLSLSPSGKWMAALTDDYHLSLVHLADDHVYSLGEMTPLEYRFDDYVGPYWSPRKDVFAYIEKGRLRVIDLTRGFRDATDVGSNLGEFPWHYEQSRIVYDDNLNPPAFTADGQYLVALVLVKDVVQVAVVPVDGRPARLFPLREGRPVDRNTDSEDLRKELWAVDLFRTRVNLLWQPRTDYFYVQYSDYETAETVIDEIDLRTGKARHLKRLHAELHSVGAVPGGVLTLYEDFTTPGNLFRLFPGLLRDRNPSVPLSVSKAAMMVLRHTAVSTISTVVPTRNGDLRRVSSAVLAIRGTEQPPPAVVSIYPGYQGFWAINRFPETSGSDPVPIARFLACGYAVVLPHTLGLGPYRPTVEQVETKGIVDSLLPQLYHAASKGLIDVRRVAIIGFSQGGHGAVAAVTGSNLFRAAISISGVRMAPFAQQAVLLPDDLGYLDNSHLESGLEVLFENAPYYRAAEIRSPLLLIHGDADPTFHSSELMAEALRTAGKRFEFVPYKNVGHDLELWPQKDLNDLSERVLHFLDENVKPVRVLH